MGIRISIECDNFLAILKKKWKADFGLPFLVETFSIYSAMALNLE